AGDIRKLVNGAGKLHAVDFGGVDEPLHMFAEAEDRWALRSLVAADAFEDGGAVADDVRKDVELGIVPVDPFPVVPDLLGGLNRHSRSLGKALAHSPHLQTAEYGSESAASMRLGAPKQLGQEPNWREKE